MFAAPRAAIPYHAGITVMFRLPGGSVPLACAVALLCAFALRVGKKIRNSTYFSATSLFARIRRYS